MKVTIDAKTHMAWGNPHNPNIPKDYGNYTEGVALVSQRGLCCVGFYGLAIGLPEQEMFGKGFPRGCPSWPREDSMIYQTEPAMGDLGNLECSLLFYDLAEVNDDHDISYDDKIQEIQRLGAAHGIEFEFVNQIHE